MMSLVPKLTDMKLTGLSRLWTVAGLCWLAPAAASTTGNLLSRTAIAPAPSSAVK